MTTIMGTSHFVSKSAAIAYYADYGSDAAEAERKLAEGEIHIGEPEVSESQYVTTIDNGRRYALVDLITRKAYMAATGTDEERRNAHNAYYAQFVTNGVREIVKRNIGAGRIRAAKDQWFNDIPLSRWDALEPSIRRACNQRALGKAEGYPKGKFGWSLGDAVCIAKAAAREIRGW